MPFSKPSTHAVTIASCSFSGLLWGIFHLFDKTITELKLDNCAHLNTTLTTERHGEHIKENVQIKFFLNQDCVKAIVKPLAEGLFWGLIAGIILCLLLLIYDGIQYFRHRKNDSENFAESSDIESQGYELLMPAN